MAASLLALIDDIASLLDDVSAMTQLAARKTAGVLGDDLALNAQQVSGSAADRELPVVWAVARGSLRNKAILVPVALALSALAPWAVTPLLMVGGLYLCFEGVEKLAHRGGGPSVADAVAPAAAPMTAAERTAAEAAKVAGAVRTDFILSGEIIAITLGTVAGAPLLEQALVLAAVAVAMTVGVYGLVAAIVKVDDLGLWLITGPLGTAGAPSAPGDRRRALSRAVGRALLAAAPRAMRLLGVLGTAAMFLVGGGILSHGLPGWADTVHHLAATAGPLAATLLPPLADMALGVAAGSLALGAVTLLARLRRR